MGLTEKTMRRLINQRDAAPKTPRHWLLQENQKRAHQHLLYRSYPTDFDQELPVDPEWSTTEERQHTMKELLRDVAAQMLSRDKRL